MATSASLGSSPPDLQRGEPGADCSLAELAVGEVAVVVAVHGDSRARLGDLGFLPGTPVTLLRRAPLGDPAVYALRGTRLCLRRDLAQSIAVRLLDPGEGPAP